MTRISGGAFLADLRKHPHSSPFRHSHVILDSVKWPEMKITMEGVSSFVILSLPQHSYDKCRLRMMSEWRNEVKWGGIFERRLNPWIKNIPHPTFISSFLRHFCHFHLIPHRSVIQTPRLTFHFKVIPSSFGHHLMLISTGIARMREE